MSDSDDAMEIDVSDERDEVDDSICPSCRKSTYVGETISCETCQYWFHFECVGVTHDDECVRSEDAPFYCPKCRKLKKVVKSKSSAKSKRKESARQRPTKREKIKDVSKKVTKPVVETQVPQTSEPKSPSIKLKISFNAKKVDGSPTPKPPVDNVASKIAPPLAVSTPTIAPVNEPLKKKSTDDSDDEEEKWLDAVESGNLHAVDDELKRIRDPKLMTARQRAMISKTVLPQSANSPAPPAEVILTGSAPVSLAEDGHMSLDFGGKKKSSIPEELQQEQRAIKSQKRKELELVKREEHKKKTMDKLLLKKDSKVAKSIKASTKTVQSDNNPKWTYHLTRDGATLSLPAGEIFPVKAAKIVELPRTPVKCSVSDCNENKRYSCSKTGKPLCSLACYKKNLDTMITMS